MGSRTAANDRRPISARSWTISQKAASLLARAGVTPNAISVAGMLAGIAAGVALGATSWLTGWQRGLAWLVGALLVQARLVANMLDGMVAIEGGKKSAVGAL
jgi:phosphatidylglycerophosphate synthase